MCVPEGGDDPHVHNRKDVINAVVSIYDVKKNSMTSSQTDSETRLRVGDLSDSDRVSDSDTVISDVSSAPEMVMPLNMDESWLVTPPPCFTAGVKSQKNKPRVTRLENLLIENPCMDVLKKRSLSNDNNNNRSRSNSPGSVVTRGMAERARQVVLKENAKKLQEKKEVLKTKSPRRPHAVASRAGLLESQTENLKYMQSQARKRESCNKSKSNISRNNKVQHYNSSSRQQSRKDKISKPSGANNNRKCHS